MSPITVPEKELGSLRGPGWSVLQQPRRGLLPLIPEANSFAESGRLLLESARENPCERTAKSFVLQFRTPFWDVGGSLLGAPSGHQNSEHLPKPPRLPVRAVFASPSSGPPALGQQFLQRELTTLGPSRMVHDYSQDAGVGWTNAKVCGICVELLCEWCVLIPHDANRLLVWDAKVGPILMSETPLNGFGTCISLTPVTLHLHADRRRSQVSFRVQRPSTVFATVWAQSRLTPFCQKLRHSSWNMGFKFS